MSLALSEAKRKEEREREADERRRENEERRYRQQEQERQREEAGNATGGPVPRDKSNSFHSNDEVKDQSANALIP